MGSGAGGGQVEEFKAIFVIEMLATGLMWKECKLKTILTIADVSLTQACSPA